MADNEETQALKSLLATRSVQVEAAKRDNADLAARVGELESDNQRLTGIIKELRKEKALMANIGENTPEFMELYKSKLAAGLDELQAVSVTRRQIAANNEVKAISVEKERLALETKNKAIAEAELKARAAQVAAQAGKPPGK